MITSSAKIVILSWYKHLYVCVALLLAIDVSTCITSTLRGQTIVCQPEWVHTASICMVKYWLALEETERHRLCVSQCGCEVQFNRIHANALFTFHIRTILSLEYKQSTYWFLNQCQRHFFRVFALRFSFICFPILGYVRISVIHFSCHFGHVRSKFVVKLNGASLVEWHLLCYVCLYLYEQRRSHDVVIHIFSRVYWDNFTVW